MVKDFFILQTKASEIRRSSYSQPDNGVLIGVGHYIGGHNEKASITQPC
jgi:hypothetical protein